jgi:cell division transport system ATP-binding protein
MIELKHAYKTYPGPKHVLKDANLDIHAGEFVFLMGPSGAGKTTLFRVLSAFDKLSSGYVSVLGNSLTDMSAEGVPYFRRKIGVVYQDFRLLANRSVFENVALPLEILNYPEDEIDDRVREMLDAVGLLHRASDSPIILSGGEQQRVAIARSLIHKPGILLADEPTGNLDAKLSRDILALFKKINNQGTTLFIATHDEALVQSAGHRIIRIHDGQLESL